MTSVEPPFSVALRLPLAEVDGVVDALQKYLVPGTWFFLDGDLGAGKTTLTKAFSRRFCESTATSPTYSIMQTYFVTQPQLQKKGVYQFLHLDFYRMKSARELMFLGLEISWEAKNTIGFFEWATMVNTGEWNEFFHVTGCEKPSRVVQIFISLVNDDTRLYDCEVVKPF